MAALENQKKQKRRKKRSDSVVQCSRRRPSCFTPSALEGTSFSPVRCVAAWYTTVTVCRLTCSVCHFGILERQALSGGSTRGDLCSVRAPAGLGVERPMGLGKVISGCQWRGEDLDPGAAKFGLASSLSGVQKALERRKFGLRKAARPETA